MPAKSLQRNEFNPSAQECHTTAMGREIAIPCDAQDILPRLDHSAFDFALEVMRAEVGA